VAEVTIQIAATGNDGSDHPAYGWIVDVCYFGGTVSGTAPVAGVRFPAVNVPQGATIDSAVLTIVEHSVAAGSIANIHVRWYGHAIDDAPDWGAASLPSGITKTTAYADMDPATWVIETARNITVTSIIQEIINRAGWAANNDLRLALFNDGSTAENYAYFVDYSDGVPSYAAKLVINYTEAASSNIKTVNGLAKANVKTVNQLAIASVKTWGGLG